MDVYAYLGRYLPLRSGTRVPEISLLRGYHRSRSGARTSTTSWYGSRGGELLSIPRAAFLDTVAQVAKFDLHTSATR
jgi:hypothetical protein